MAHYPGFQTDALPNPEEGVAMVTTLGHILRTAAKRFGAKTALIVEAFSSDPLCQRE